MDVVYNDSLNPYFNLAAEEFFLQNASDSTLILWRNRKSVIIGKNQNAYSEINDGFARENDIPIVRRLTGGGAVFHDPNNINYTFITLPSENGIDFSRFLAPVCDILRGFGVNAEYTGKNDITVDNLKISGNAQCLFDRADGKKMLLHHGTLLFDADIGTMTGVLRASEAKLESHGIKSVSSRVTNIRGLASYFGPETAESFLFELLKRAEKQFCTYRTICPEEKEKIDRVAKQKYQTWEWNYGRSPGISALRKKRFPFGEVSVQLDADRGVIEKVVISGDFIGAADISKFEKKLIGIRLDREAVEVALADCGEYFFGSTPDDIISLIID